MRDVERVALFLNMLAAKGVSYRVMWECRRDGAKPSWPKKKPDLYGVAFSGDGFRPSVDFAVISVFRESDAGYEGFAVYHCTAGNEIVADVELISKPC